MNTPNPESATWVRRRIRWTIFVVFLLVVSLGVGILIAIAAGLAPIDGLWIGSWLFLAGFMGAQIVVPGRMIEWRARMMVGGPAPLHAFGMAYNTLFGIGTTPDRRSKRNLGLLAGTLLVGSTFVIALMWSTFHLAGVG